MKKLLVAVLLLICANSYSQTLEDDRLALIAFYNAADGQSWFSERPHDNPTWQVPGQPGDNPCSWNGVTCEGNRVVGLALSGEDVSGTIPKEIGNLTALKSLILPGGGFFQFQRPTLYGSLPLEFANLVNLETLDLSANFFDEENSHVLFSLPKLKSLSFSASWQIPAAIGNLSNLETLVIDNGGTINPVENLGAFPVEISNLTKLTSLRIHNTRFRSGIPTEIGNLINLKSLYMSAAVQVGSIPASIGNLAELTSLYYSEMPNSGPVPSEIGNLVKLTRLEVTGLGNAGPIPTTIGNLINLDVLDLHGNGHTGTIPASFNKLTKINYLALFNNYLNGPLPTLSSLRSRKIDIRINNFTFDVLETYENRFSQYSDQRKIPVMRENGVLSVNAGGTMSRNTYRWYYDNLLVATKTGDNTFTPTDLRDYRVEVTNTIAVGARLVSETVRSPLPVTLMNFEAMPQDGRNQLTWKTTSETNNKGFEIERSRDARTFEKIGFVEGAGDAQQTESYRFTDLDPFNITYYRLKQLDHNGVFENSKIIMVKNEREVIIYPNPARGFLTVSGIDSEKDMSVLNQVGDIVLKQKVEPLKPVHIGTLPNGIYTIKIGGTTKRVAISK
ncbi:T9SS type A sorting domain-containing protein [Dyadobacter sp. CY343]|uniref:T9SS type A sorting domain-containing protein n=1 Tax=Dyadobacter sp. CY343 TaxID=2907299 RepID=UPI001F1B5A4E|nr:T9SS type A sorting domain-containing protein [Dyadobacter sp. CY343]MCE7058649.1 T9SS type A sorting domain-containing protein [Dyadobacter sp. CY343]